MSKMKMKKKKKKQRSRNKGEKREGNFIGCGFPLPLPPPRSLFIHCQVVVVVVVGFIVPTVLIDWLIDCRWLILKLLCMSSLGFSLPVWLSLSLASLSLPYSLFLLLSVWFMLVCRVINAVYFISRQPAQWGNSTAAEMKNVKVFLSLSLLL